MTYMSAAENAKNIRKALKAAHGWTGRQVSVRCSTFSMGDSVSVSIKDADIPLNVVKEIAKANAETDRTSRFLHVDYETGSLDSLYALLADEISSAIDGNGSALGIFSVCVTGHELRIFGADGSCVVNGVTAGCDNTAQTAAYRLARHVAATGILSGWEVAA